MISLETKKQAIKDNVRAALSEDVGAGDITAFLIPEDARATAKVICRESAIICGVDWFNEVFHQVDTGVEIDWQIAEGDRVSENQTLVTLSGSSRSLLTGERCALNFLQSLSGTATLCNDYASLVAETKVKILDTRKTIPGLRIAQKHAVVCGGCYNHRIGLFDAFLIKENHIAACGSISDAVKTARKNAPEKPVEVEVESLQELDEALAAGCDQIMLDNFKLEDMVAAVKLTNGRALLEASGGINSDTILPIARTGVDYISIGALTKDCTAVDLSMRLD
ncbi:UNVERIFIED_CONTAM: hypothetical protein GTU68_023595 [Idotea baltica]|nr:hypothetical protein [Idotea baltica]